ncbi:MAG: S8 family serine peptidase [Leptolyngbyaceae bacterium]|nr:S8 family serine peptidase [Leptolyngbyaceae bacterium]
MKNQFDLQLPPQIFAEVVLRSQSGESLLRSAKVITSETVSLFHAPNDVRLEAAQRLRAAGFEVLDIGQFSINVAAPPAVYERSLGAQLEMVQRPVVKAGQATMAEFVNSADPAPLGEIHIAGTGWSDILDGVAINNPAYYLRQQQTLHQATTSGTPPPTPTHYLQVPHDLAQELGATLAHQRGITGKGVTVVVVDTGCDISHGYFKRHGYDIRVELGPGATNPTLDANGHGTGIVANVLAIAPHASVTMVKADVAVGQNHHNINSTAAFRKAMALNPDIISCSWGSDLRSPHQLSSSHKVLAGAIAEAVRRGIVVIFAAGNGQWGFPAQHPDVIAVGGVYKHLEGSLKGHLEASNYASSFISAIYPNRRVPDVCGLVGQLPNAAYIMLPVPSGSPTDWNRSVMGDETAQNDGWAAFSGTSSAAPQLAGACALLEQFVPGLPPLKIKEILQDTAEDILEGGSNPSTGSGQARAGPDLATGAGLAAASKAMEAAQKSQSQSVSHFDIPVPTASGTVSNINTQANIRKLQPKRKVKTMSLDDSTLRQLRKKIDEIQIDLNTYLKTLLGGEINKDFHDLQLVISERNFIERDSDFEAISYSLKVLRELIQPNKSKIEVTADQKQEINTFINASIKEYDDFKKKIKKKHLFAAKNLLRKDKCKGLAHKILLKAIQLSGEGKYETWEIKGKDKEGENISYSVTAENVAKLTTKEVGSLTVITGIDGLTQLESARLRQISLGTKVANVNSDIDATSDTAATDTSKVYSTKSGKLFYQGIPIPKDFVTVNNDTIIAKDPSRLEVATIQVQVVGDFHRKKVEDIKDMILSYTCTDLDEIAELASKILSGYDPETVFWPNFTNEMLFDRDVEINGMHCERLESEINIAQCSDGYKYSFQNGKWSKIVNFE